MLTTKVLSLQCARRLVTYWDYVPQQVAILSIPSLSYSGQPLTDQERYRATLPPRIRRIREWFSRLRPFKEELAEFERRRTQLTHGYDWYQYDFCRYFVRFPFLLDSEFSRWIITCDRDHGRGYSWAEFVRSPRAAAGSSLPIDPHQKPPAHTNSPQLSTAELEEEDDSHPFSRNYPLANPSICPSPAGRDAANAAVVVGAVDSQFRGYGLFRGFLSTRVPDRGDLVRAGYVNLSCPDLVHFGRLRPYPHDDYTHMIIRYRGDGRSYRINLHPIVKFEELEHDIHHFVLYTRGGPYWQIAKIPLAKFFLLRRGLISRHQADLEASKIRSISFTLMDGVDGPFSLELDYIQFYMDPDDIEEDVYEQYDRSGIVQ